MTPKKRGRFLEALRGGATVKDAADQAGHARKTFYGLRNSDPAFAALWEEAYDEGTDILEREAQRRAVEGVEDFKQVGDQTMTVRRYSDTLLIFLLKARRPGKFRESVKVEHGGTGGGAIEVRLAFDPTKASE